VKNPEVSFNATTNLPGFKTHSEKEAQRNPTSFTIFLSLNNKKPGSLTVPEAVWVHVV